MQKGCFPTETAFFLKFYLFLLTNREKSITIRAAVRGTLSKPSHNMKIGDATTHRKG